MKSQKSVSNLTEAGSSRRSFFKRAGTLAGATVAAGSGAMLLASAPKAQAFPPSPPTQTDLDILNFALNLEYLEAEFYLRGVYGDSGLDARVPVTGVGAPGTVVIKANPGVPFKTTAVKEYALEIAQHEQQHVQYLRAALGDQAIARPQIDLLNSFNTLAQAAGLGDSFDPFLSEANFILASYIFEDVGVTAYSGASTLLTDPDILQAAAKILSVEAYHGGLLRLLNFQAGLATQVAADRISNLRGVLGGGNDRGILNGNLLSQIVPVDNTSLAFARTTREVLNVVYGAVGASAGLFFPNGVNGNIVS